MSGPEATVVSRQSNNRTGRLLCARRKSVALLALTQFGSSSVSSQSSIVIRPDCDCSICRAERGQGPLTTAQLKAKREAKR